MNIISFSGLRKSGKSQAADYVCQIDNRFKKVSFAGILKDAYARENGIDRAILDDILQKEKHRRAMQAFGDAKRKIDRYYFAIALANTFTPTGFYVTEDTRYLEECETLLKLGGKMCGIFSETHKRADRGWIYDPIADTHMSETELGYLNSQTWNALGGELVYNNGTKEQLKDKIERLVRKHFPYTMKDLELLSSNK